MSALQEHYQYLYDHTDYGQSSENKCASIRYLPVYEPHIAYANVLELGCGTGDAVLRLRQLGYDALGIDWINPTNEFCARGDFTGMRSFSGLSMTILCIDVLEYIPEEQLHRVLASLGHTPDIQFICSVQNLEGQGNDELRFTVKPLDWWIRLFRNHFGSVFMLTPDDEQERKIFACQ